MSKDYLLQENGVITYLSITLDAVLVENSLKLLKVFYFSLI